MGDHLWSSPSNLILLYARLDFGNLKTKETSHFHSFETSPFKVLFMHVICTKCKQSQLIIQKLTNIWQKMFPSHVSSLNINCQKEKSKLTWLMTTSHLRDFKLFWWFITNNMRRIKMNYIYFFNYLNYKVLMF